MALSAFADKSDKPGVSELRSVLGPAYEAWNALIKEAGARVPQLSEVWAYTSTASGWSLRLRRKERVIVYMTPSNGQFLVSFALGERAVAAAHAAGLPARLLRAIDEAPRYAEGRGVRVVVRGMDDVAGLAWLAEIKQRN